MKIFIVLVLVTVQLAAGVIHRLNDSEYARLPPLYRLDEYNGCLRAPGDTYCFLDAKLSANGTSELMTFIEEYSANNVTHFDHTIIHWGLCVTQLCEGYFSNATGFRQGLEACLNDTLYESYQLQANVMYESTYCTSFGETQEIDTGDYVVAVVYIVIVWLNIVGNVYEFFLYRGSKSFASRFLLCFSMKRNWFRLVAPSGEGPDPKLQKLKALNGFKILSTFLVILAHSSLITLMAIDNPHFQETSYYQPIFQIMYNGTLIVQTFFVLSGFLLAFNTLVMSEKRPIRSSMLFFGTLLRWLRLTPTYAAVLAFVSTWLRHLSSGPLWKPVVDIEVVDCRRDWWLHLLYIDNYVDKSQCMPQTWYLSCDMQLSILGLMIFCLFQSARARKVAIAVTFVVGLLTPAVHTFFQNLNPILIVSPEAARRYFVEDLTFNNLYKRGHTNIVGYALGLALGMALYNLLDKEVNVEKYKKYRVHFWCFIPVGFAIPLLGMLFYTDGIQVPFAVNVVYSSAVKALFSACMCVGIAGCILKVDTVIRGALQWRGWAPLSRLSYCAYLVHVCVIRTSTAHLTTLQHSTVYKIVLLFCGIMGVTFMLAFGCYMLVEAPTTMLVKLCIGGSSPSKHEESKDKSAKSSSSSL